MLICYPVSRFWLVALEHEFGQFHVGYRESLLIVVLEFSYWLDAHLFDGGSKQRIDE